MKVEGQIAMWRYRQARSGYRGFHTTADAVGSASLVRAFAGLETKLEMSVPLVAPTSEILAVPNNTRDQAVSYTRLSVVAVQGRGIQRFTHSHPRLTLEASPDMLAEICAGYQAVAAGEGDFSIGPNDHEIWFWWWPKRG